MLDRGLWVVWYVLGSTDIDVRDGDGHSALSMAVSHGNVLIMKWLLEHGAKARQKASLTRDGEAWEWGSLLALAKEKRSDSEEMVDLLKRFGAK